MADALGLSELREYESQKEMYENRDRIHDVIEDHTTGCPTEEVVDDLVEADVQAAEVAPPQEIVDHP